MTRLMVHGARGRMGQRICSLAEADPRFELVAIPAKVPSHDDTALSCDVIVDFSAPEGAQLARSIAVSIGAALLVGTTGLPAPIVRELDDAARFIPVMIAPNTAFGVAVVDHLTAVATRLLGREWTVGIRETHHRGKKDAPSGTALRLAETVAETSGVRVPPERIVSVREGEVVGDHVIRFDGEGEHVEIRHSAGTRDLFAAGALRAAAWLHGRPAGRYSIRDVLGLERPAVPD